MRILRARECNIGKEIAKLKQQLSLLDGLATHQRTTVLKIINDVRNLGDKAVVKYTKCFDKVSLSPDEFQVKDKEIEDSYKKISLPFVKSIQRAISNIRTYQGHIKIRNVGPLKANGVALDTLYFPIESVGVYVPGGAASYPSTVLMNTVPAKVAGVDKIIMTTPPAKNGIIPPERLVAARESGVNEIYKVGGAQAIAALAFGTKTIPKVDKIVGPGNIFVTLAKKEIFGFVDIDMLAGPSEVVILANQFSDKTYVTQDLMAQAEHFKGLAVLVTTSKKFAKTMKAEDI